MKIQELLFSLRKFVAPNWGRGAARNNAPREADFHRLHLEEFEQRLVPSTAYVSPIAGAGHYASFQQAYAVAKPGDVIQIEPGEVIKSLNMNPVTINKRLMIQGDPAYGAALVASDVEVLTGTTGVVFSNLNFKSTNGLILDAGSKQTSVLNSTLTEVTENIGAGNYGNIISGNVITGFALLNGDPSIQTGDQVTGNTFTGPGVAHDASLYMINNNSATVSNNTFTVNGGIFDRAIHIVNSANVSLDGNNIHFSSPDSTSIGMLVEQSAYFPGTSSAHIWQNSVSTGGLGTGLYLDKEVAGNNMSMDVEFDNFNNNAVGVFIQGDGASAGVIDLGGGSLGSHGGNNFAMFTPTAAVSGHFAISLHDTSSSYTVPAWFNIWQHSITTAWFDAHTVTKDGADGFVNDAIDTSLGGTEAGTGQIIMETASGPIPTGGWPHGHVPIL